ncbi:hypothetical protein [Magnetospirillum sp. 64-120]|uniref:sulfotransferase n=1 Tax=Magnetospirillum sp. 64-120 TaxID=1895778 RepID=UPI0009270264|nr:hypothetical protein [Magnetospirillum sp. 64-120]OJX70341.1 MAG: hypothetical protein BGO92_17270 [Magnetospirillum sp. 64-120]
MSLPQAAVLHHLARSGGTVITRCVAAASSAVLLSEIHPLMGHWHDPRTQVGQGFPLDENERSLGPRSPANAHCGMVADIVAIANACAQRGAALLLRDWNHIDFVPNFMVSQPSYRLTLVDVLKPHLALHQVVSVRHPLDQWLSTIVMAKAERTDLDRFLMGCRKFAETATAMGFVRYEDFVADPEAWTQEICRRLGLPCEAGFLERAGQLTNVTRDTTGIRGAAQVTVLSRRPHSPQLLAHMRANADYQATVEMLGYAP